MNTQAIRIRAVGGPSNMRVEESELPPPGRGQVLVRQRAIGVNFIDTYHRSGLYPLELPSGLGIEAAGVVVAAGPGVRGLRAGTRVGYAGGAVGAYARERLVAADRLVLLPDGISDATAAATMLKGMTAHMLLTRVYRLRRGQTILAHAAAGGVGLLLGQWARAIGVTAIGTAGNAQKCALARRHGYAHVIDYSRQDFVAEVRRLTGGAGVPVVYDSVGRDTFEQSMDCLAPRGMLVSYGDASGPPPPVSCTTLGRRGSFFLTRPVVTHYTTRRADLVKASRALFEMISTGRIHVRAPRRYRLSDAATCHADLEQRRITGSSILIP